MATGLMQEPRAEESVAAERRTTELGISGMTCSNCARHVTEAIQGVSGVRSALVNLDGGTAKVTWESGAEPDVEAVVQAVTAEGFGAALSETKTHGHGEHGLAGWQLNLLLGVPVTALLMIGEWILGWGPARWFQWLSFGLAGAVQVFAGTRFYRGAWNQLKVGSANMDALVALGSTTAFGFSTWALLSGHPGHLYFMEAASIITLISVGHWFESRVSLRASGALRKLLDLSPMLARKWLPDGSEREVAVAELRAGDLIRLRPGDRVPTDGEVLEGSSVVDESMLTGESVPVDKQPGAPLFAGTNNHSGLLTMRVTATGDATALAHIIAAVQRAQSSRANIQRLGDRVSSVFVPIVVVIALLAGLWWGLAPHSAHNVHAWLASLVGIQSHAMTAEIAAGFITAAAVLIVACPCAMGLATPAAIMAGANAAAQRGILIRDGIALEKAGRVTAVAFDKTGTLTLGKPSVVQTWADERAGEFIAPLDLAVALAKHSTHPISQAIAQLGASRIGIGNLQEIHGSGVQGEVTPESTGSPAAPATLAVQLGSLRWLRDSGADLESGERFIEEWSTQGATIVGVVLGRRLVGLFAVKDTVKPGARGVVEQLQRQGLKVYLVTGDNALTARRIAEQTGIAQDDVFAEIRPERKADFVKELQGRGERVAFVGDGINDAPALEQAELGIAVARASDIAREAADIILLRSEIEAVPESLGLARATLRTIKQNLFWAFFYNSVGIPLAALGFMSPIVCAAAMGLSDLVVIGNALRLRRWRL
jgi:P-type Cu+ transporter